MKEIVSITGALLDRFRPLLPGRLTLAHQTLLGCQEGEEPLGCAIIERCGDAQTLSWLCVGEYARRQGVGSALLDAACCLALEWGALELSYPSRAPWAVFLDGMAAARGGLLRTVELPCFCLTGEELLQTPLLQGIDPKSIRYSAICPLNALSAYQLRVLRTQCEENGIYNVSRAAFELADPQRSMVLLDHRQVVGLTLVREEQEGCFALDLFYLAQGSAAWGLPLLRCTAAALLPLRQLQMVCVNETVQALGTKLLGAEHCSTRALTCARLCREWYIPRSEAAKTLSRD